MGSLTTQSARLTTLLVAFSAAGARGLVAWSAAVRPAGRARVSCASNPSETDTVIARLSQSDDLAALAGELIRLDATALALAQLTDAIEQAPAGADPGLLASGADVARRLRRRLLLADMLRADRAAYLETVSFLRIPRAELPNLQDVPIRPWDPQPTRARGATGAAAGVSSAGSTASAELVDDCALPPLEMGENLLEGALLRITRDIYAEETGTPRRREIPGILGLVDEMRSFMLSPGGASAEAQQQPLLRTLLRLMTPALPPFYRVFMGGIVPSLERGDPAWLVDGVQAVAGRLPAGGADALQPGKQLGPLPWSPLLTALVAPFAFGFLVGPSAVNLRSDGQLGGLVVTKCKFLQESSCKGMCLNSCKQPAQQLFEELGLPLRVIPNFETQECQWSFGEAAPPVSEDPAWPSGCLVGCSSREAMRALGRTERSAPVCS